MNRPDPEPPLPSFPELAQETLVGGDEPAFTLDRQSEIEAIIRWMVEFDRNARGGSQQGTSRHKLDWRGLKKPRGEKRFVL